MYPFVRGLLGAALAVVGLTGLAVSPGAAQQAPNPNLRYAPNRQANAARDQAVLTNQTAPANVAFRYGSGPSAPYYPGYGYNPYGGYRPTRAEGYLNGEANVMTSYGQYQQQIQGAKLQRQQAIQSSIDTRRKMFDERQYELANTPTQQERLNYQRQMREQEARDNASTVQIIAGDTLNTLLEHSQKIQAQGFYGPKIPLDPQTLAQINVASPTTGGNTGMLGDGGKLDWPLPLLDPAYDMQRKKIDDLLGQAVEEATKYGKVNARLQAELLDAQKKFQDAIDARVAAVTPTQFVQSKRYLRELKDNLKILDDPNVGKFFGGAYKVQGDTVAALIENMTRQGVKFGPAARGEEGAYLSLYQSMRAYDVALLGLVSAAPTGPRGGPPTRP
jgi:hypothetical protein